MPGISNAGLSPSGDYILQCHPIVTYITTVNRDREATRARILAATEQIIARDGVAAARVNAIAAAAGLDKVLLYRYFGGREGILNALARERTLWPPTESSADPSDSLPADLTASLLASALALRSQPLPCRSAIWSLTEDDDFATQAASAREEQLRHLIDAMRDRHPIPRYLDLDAMIALLTAALTHLALQATNSGHPIYAGLDLSRDTDWRRLERILRTIVHSMTSTPGV